MSTESGPGHNSQVGGIAADRLRSIIERYERLAEEKAALSSDQRDIMTEAASSGFDKKIIAQLIRLRKMDSAEREKQDSLRAVYMHALGM